MLHTALEAFTLDVAGALQAEKAGGAEVPFEVVEEPGRRTPLYCYRALTGEFISERLGILTALPSYGAVARALEGIETLPAYLRHRGVTRVPSSSRERVQVTLEFFLSAVFAERSQFEFHSGRFEAAFAELERTLYEGRCVTTAVAPLFGVALEHGTDSIVLGDGLALVRGETLEDAPFEPSWSEGEEASVLAVLSSVQDRREPAPVVLARAQFRRLLRTLRLFEPGAYAIGPLAWMRVDTGRWRPLALPFSGHPGSTRVIASQQEDELRGFFHLVARRTHTNGRLAWALERFGMATERLTPYEALTDYLLAARALLEPEGPGHGRLSDRLAAICAAPADRARVREGIARSERLERLLISGSCPAPEEEALVPEFSEHLRALLRDLLCGHLGLDVCALADELLREQAVHAMELPPGPGSSHETANEEPTDELKLGSDQVGFRMDR